GEARPITAGDLNVGSARAGDDRRTRASLVTVEFAGQQCTERDCVTLELHHLDLQALLLGKAAPARHENEPGVALGLDDAMAPGLQLRSVRCGRDQRC